jgi:hypothetical protein
MTSKELIATDQIALSMNGWLKEIAVQLALLNEKRPIEIPAPLPKLGQRRPN